MARPTRQQRRARRSDGSEETFSQRARARQAQIKPTQSKKGQGGRKPEDHRRFRLVRESYGELKKVDWPGRRQLTQGTIVVILACAIVSTYLYACDIAFQNLVKTVLLGQ